MSKIVVRKVIGFVVVFAFLFFLAAYFLDNRDVFQELRNVKLYYLVPDFILTLFQFYINGLLIKFLFEPFGIKLKEHFLLSISASFINLTMPLKAGAGARGIYMKKKYNLSYTSFASTLFASYIIVFLVTSGIGILVQPLLYFYYEIFNIYVFLLFTFTFFINNLEFFESKVKTIKKALELISEGIL